MTKNNNILEVLIVEDDFADMENCCRIIGKEYPTTNIHKAGNEKDALEVLADQDIDIAFIDIELPDGNGFALASKIRSMPQYRLMQIVFVTGERSKKPDAYENYHCYAYIEKPYTAEEFRKRVTDLIDGLIAGKREGDVRVRKVAKVFDTDFGSVVIAKDDFLFAEI